MRPHSSSRHSGRAAGAYCCREVGFSTAARGSVTIAPDDAELLRRRWRGLRDRSCFQQSLRSSPSAVLPIAAQEPTSPEVGGGPPVNIPTRARIHMILLSFLVRAMIATGPTAA